MCDVTRMVSFSGFLIRTCRFLTANWRMNFPDVLALFPMSTRNRNSTCFIFVKLGDANNSERRG